MRNFRNFTGKDVVVRAMGSVYRGRLIEMTETSVLLKMATGHAEIASEGISSIEEAKDSGGGFLSPSPLAGMASKDGE